MIEQVKNTEQARSEYRFMSAFEMDARYYGREEGREEGRQEGREEGIQVGLAQGRSEGFSDGARQTKLETAKLMKQANCENNFIVQMTGLSLSEIEKL